MKTRILYPKNIWYNKVFHSLSHHSMLIAIYLVSNENIGLTRIYRQNDLEIQFIFKLTESELNKIKKELQEAGLFIFKDEWIYINNDLSYCDYQGRDRVMESKSKEESLIPEEILNYFKEVVNRLTTGYKPPINHKPKIINHKPKTKEKEKEKEKKSREFMESKENFEALKKHEIIGNYFLSWEYFCTMCSKVVDYSESHGKKYKDYPAALRNFIKSDIEKGKLRAIVRELSQEERERKFEEAIKDI